MDDDIVRVVMTYLSGNAPGFVNMLPDSQFLLVKPIKHQYGSFRDKYFAHGAVFDVLADLVQNGWYFANDEKEIFHRDNAEVLPLQSRTKMYGEYEVEKTEHGLVHVVREIEPVPAVAALRTKDGFLDAGRRVLFGDRAMLMDVESAAKLLYKF